MQPARREWNAEATSTPRARARPRVGPKHGVAGEADQKRAHVVVVADAAQREVVRVEAAHVALSEPDGLVRAAREIAGLEPERAPGEPGDDCGGFGEAKVVARLHAVRHEERLRLTREEGREDGARVEPAAESERRATVEPRGHGALDEPPELFHELALVSGLGRLQAVAPPLVELLAAGERKLEG